MATSERLRIDARRTTERGEGRIGLIIALVVVAALVYFLVMYIPVRITAAELEKEVEDATRKYVVNQLSYDELMETIRVTAEELGIRLEDEAIRIDEGSNAVHSVVRYDVPVGYIWGEKVHSFTVEAKVPKI